MLRNYLQVAVRNIYKYLFYSVINILGLAIGLACCMLIVTYVSFELSYDKYHADSERIYRAYMDANFGASGQQKLTVTPNILAPLFQSEFPEIEKSVRVYDYGRFRPMVLKAGQESYQEKNFYFADSSIFSVFTFNAIEGDLSTALNNPRSLVLTESAAKKYFGESSSLGKPVTINNRSEYVVTGVVADMQENSHFRFDMVASFSSISQGQPENHQWGSANYYTYFVLTPGAAPEQLEDKIAVFVDKQLGEQYKTYGYWIDYKLQPLSDIHLNSEFSAGTGTGGDMRYVIFFSLIAVIILLIACINYMNLATARASDRAKEVGMRKMLGARKGELFSQFIGESALITLVSIILGIVLVELMMPYFSEFTGNMMSVNYTNINVIVGIIGVWLGVSFVAGSYPALILSRFIPSKVLKGSFRSSVRGSLLRRALVVFQFMISIFLIIGTLVVYKQLTYMQQKKLGYNNEQVVALPLDHQIINKLPVFKAQFKTSPFVSEVTAASETPTSVRGGYSFTTKNRPSEESQETQAMAVDWDFVKVLEIEIVYGRDFQEADSIDDDHEFIINESVVNARGWDAETAIGTEISLNGREGEIIGVMKDFHFSSMHRPIGPLVLFLDYYQLNTMMAKISGDITSGINDLEKVWKVLAPHRPFDYDFLDAEYSVLYKKETKVGQLFTIFSVLTILIACLGLFGLASFTAVQRSKEISVRKVMGASIAGVITLLSKDFSKLIGISFLIAAPLGFIVMNKWLANNFAYKIEVGIETLFISGILAFAIAWLTVGYQAFKAANTNPVDVLRNE